MNTCTMKSASVRQAAGEWGRGSLRWSFCLLLVAAFSVASFGQYGSGQNSSVTAQADSDSQNLDTYIQELRADVRADKTRIISNTMNMTDAQSEKFWPIYRDYESQMIKINDDRLKLIKEYADKYSTLDDKAAKKLSNQWLDLEGQRLDLQKEYFDDIASEISPKVSAQFMQIEHRLDLLIDLKIASELPLVPTQTTARGPSH